MVETNTGAAPRSLRGALRLRMRVALLATAALFALTQAQASAEVAASSGDPGQSRPEAAAPPPAAAPSQLQLLVAAADGGNVHGMYSAGVMAEMGLGTSRDPGRARAMYRKAAESGFAPAMVKVSDDYARGSGASADLVEAYAWLQVAMQSDLPEEMQIAVLAKLNALGGRLGAQGRDEARVRVTRLAAAVRDHAVAAAAGVRDTASRSIFM